MNKPEPSPFEGDSQFDLISEIREEELVDRSYLESYTKKEDINFECDYSSINLDVSRNTIWAENTRILNDFEKDDNYFPVNSDRVGTGQGKYNKSQ